VVYFPFVVVCSAFVDTFINAVVHVFYMPNCPACGEWFSLKFAMLGHLRLSNDDRHVAYRGKKTSRKRKCEPSANLSKQNYDVLLERISSLEAKVDVQNKPQQQPAIKTETPVTSANLSRPSDNALLERISRVEAKFDTLNKTQQQPVTKTETPVTSAYQLPSTTEVLLDLILKKETKDNAQNKPQQQPVIVTQSPAVSPTAAQPKPVDWREYTNSDRPSTHPDDYLYKDDYLNRMVEYGRWSPAYIRDCSKEKMYRVKLKEEDQE
jgi:ribosomal protein L24